MSSGNRVKWVLGWVRRALSAAVGVSLALACGGSTTDESGRHTGSATCAGTDGAERAEGTVEACDCPGGGTGERTCTTAGEWSGCECAGEGAGGSGGAGAGGSGGAGAGGSGSGVPVGTVVCGNGRLDDGEECDRADLNFETCGTVSMGAYLYGALRCTAECTFDLSGCLTATQGMGGTTGGGGFVGAGGRPYPPPPPPNYGGYGGVGAAAPVPAGGASAGGASAGARG